MRFLKVILKYCAINNNEEQFSKEVKRNQYNMNRFSFVFIYSEYQIEFAGKVVLGIFMYLKNSARENQIVFDMKITRPYYSRNRKSELLNKRKKTLQSEMTVFFYIKLFY